MNPYDSKAHAGSGYIIHTSVIYYHYSTKSRDHIATMRDERSSEKLYLLLV